MAATLAGSRSRRAPSVAGSMTPETTLPFRLEEYLALAIRCAGAPLWPLLVADAARHELGLPGSFAALERVGRQLLDEAAAHVTARAAHEGVEGGHGPVDVVDELHAYRGVFGSHLANIMRRLQPCAMHP